MSAGLLCVHPIYGALSDTSGGLNIMYQGDFKDKIAHANIFINYLNSAINLVRRNDHLQMVNFNKVYADSRFNIERVKTQWENMLLSLLEKYPTPESRDIPKEMFVYKTT